MHRLFSSSPRQTATSTRSRPVLGAASILVGLIGLLAPPGGGEARAAASAPPGAAVGYRVPVEAPTGDVQVLSLGVANLPVPSLIGTERFVHLRLAAVNEQDEQDWVLDARDQVLQLSNGERLTARFAEPSGGARPARITLRRGQRGYLDLFFAVDDDPDWTSLAWVVRRGAGIIVSATVFERLPAQVAEYGHYRPAEYSGGMLVIGPVWCDPFWGDRAWLGWYAPYRRYRYARGPHGLDVSDGRTNWRYHREGPPARQETVGTRWRGQRPDPGTHVAQPAPALPQPAPARAQPVTARANEEGGRWRVQVQPVVPTAGATSSTTWSSPGRVWRAHSAPVDPSPPSPSSSFSTWSSSSSSSPSPSPSPPSEPPPSPPPSPTPAASSPPAEESVGSRWRSR
jgi:hypothetical protein